LLNLVVNYYMSKIGDLYMVKHSVMVNGPLYLHIIQVGRIHKQVDLHGIIGKIYFPKQEKSYLKRNEVISCNSNI
ncbi:MAG: hypothetical protein ACRD91_05370, partial [Nitrosopumilaceae archaeon]